MRAPQRMEMAEREGFEPSVRLPAQRFSRPPHSTTLPPLRTRSALHRGLPWVDEGRALEQAAALAKHVLSPSKGMS